jgi:hypothetical protein
MPDSSWREPYHQALRESDEQKPTDLVQAAEYAIVLRLQELENSTDNQKERAEMKRAAADLLAIKTYRLGWPEVPVTAGQIAAGAAKLPKRWRRWLFGEHNIPFN